MESRCEQSIFSRGILLANMATKLQGTVSSLKAVTFRQTELCEMPTHTNRMGRQRNGTRKIPSLIRFRQVFLSSVRFATKLANVEPYCSWCRVIQSGQV